MADNEALRALQTRLAERMQQAREVQPGRSWLAVSCAGLGLLLPLPQAGEIFDQGELLPVPHSQPWFSGVVNHRGNVCAVVDFARFLGLSEPAGGAAASQGQPRLVALNEALGAQAALRVDRLDGLRHEAELTPVESDDNAAQPAFAPARWRDAQGRVWQEINLAELARHGQFLAIAG